MNQMEQTKALRADTQTHYNCCQSVLLPFCDACGITREQAVALGAHFGGGMRHGGTCGAVTGAHMVLGLAGRGEEETRALLKALRDKHGPLDCAHLLARARENGMDRKCHCDGMVYDAVAQLQNILGE